MEGARMVIRDYRNQVGPAISCSQLRESVLQRDEQVGIIEAWQTIEYQSYMNKRRRNGSLSRTIGKDPLHQRKEKSVFCSQYENTQPCLSFGSSNCEASPSW